jgi:CRISPR-associated protein Csb1
MDELTADRLIAACGDDGADAGVTIETELEPLAGFGSPVKPAVYEGGTYQLDKRWVAGEPPRLAEVVVIDNVASQANRLEAALKAGRSETGLPEVLLDLAGMGLPVHLPRTISSFDLPHRNADAYLRDAELDGVQFIKTGQGAAIVNATAQNPAALFEWMPQALLFGFWQSHLGKKQQSTKRARAWVSEIIGYDPAAVDVKGKGLKGDPLNLSVDTAASYNDNDQREWALVEDKRKGSKSKDSLAELGHGQVPLSDNPVGLSFPAIQQRSSVSLAQLRTIHADSPQASAAGRAVLVAMGLLAHTDAFGRAFCLRSGCDLVPTGTRWNWRGAGGDRPVKPLDHAAAAALLADCAEQGRQAGLRVGRDWPQPLTLTPRPNLAKAIAATWPAGEH